MLPDLRRRLKRLELIFTVAFVLSCLNLSGCETTVKTRAYLAGAAQGWEMAHDRIGRDLETDDLTGEPATISLLLWRDKVGGRSFQVVSTFKRVDNGVAWSPSRIIVRLASGTELKAKGIACPKVAEMNDLLLLRSSSPLEEPVLLKKDDHYCLFFDHPTPPMDEEIVMYMSDSLASKDSGPDVPPVFFRKTEERRIRLGLFQ
jgi:hypothetical protein